MAWTFKEWMALLLMANNFSNMDSMKNANLGYTSMTHLRHAAVLLSGKSHDKKNETNEKDISNCFGTRVDVVPPLSEADATGELFVLEFIRKLLDEHSDKHSQIQLKGCCHVLAIMLTITRDDLFEVMKPAWKMVPHPQSLRPIATS